MLAGQSPKLRTAQQNGSGTQLSQLACPISTKFSWGFSTESVNSTVKVACEGLKAVIRRNLGDNGRLARHGIFLFLLGNERVTHGSRGPFNIFEMQISCVLLSMT